MSERPDGQTSVSPAAIPGIDSEVARRIVQLRIAMDLDQAIRGLGEARLHLLDSTLHDDRLRSDTIRDLALEVGRILDGWARDQNLEGWPEAARILFRYTTGGAGRQEP